MDRLEPVVVDLVDAVEGDGRHRVNVLSDERPPRRPAPRDAPRSNEDGGRARRGRSSDDVPSVLTRHDLVHPDGRSFHVYGRQGDWDLGRHDPATGFDPSHLHRRFDRLTGAWVLVSPTRNVRPSTTTTGAGGGPMCPLCPGGPELPGPFSWRCSTTASRRWRPTPRRSLARAAGAPRAGAAWSWCTRPTTSSTSPSCQPPAVRRRRRRVARPHRRAVGRRPRLRDGVREPRQRRRGDAPPPPRPDLRPRPRAAGDARPSSPATPATARRTASASGAGSSTTTSAASGSLTTDEHFVAAVPFAPRWPLEVHVARRPTASAGSATSTTRRRSTRRRPVRRRRPLRRAVGLRRCRT